MSLVSLNLDPEIEACILRVPLFKGVAPGQVRSLLSRCDAMDVLQGQVLISPEQENNNLYIILSGSLGVHIESLDQDPEIILGIGECVGEMSTIDGKPPSAHVVAASDTRLFVIDRSTIWQLVNLSHEVSVNLLQILSQRLRAGNDIINTNINSLRQAEHYAKIDALTQLHNRRGFDEPFERLLKRCQFENADLTAVLLDIDHFKKFNDQYGHLAGDHALRVVADLMKSAVRPYDLVARYGGEEFAIVLPFTSLDKAKVICERLRAGIENARITIPGDTATVGVTISIGIAGSLEFDDAPSLLNSADAALYRAKSAGRNRVSI